MKRVWILETGTINNRHLTRSELFERIIEEGKKMKRVWILETGTINNSTDMAVFSSEAAAVREAEDYIKHLTRRELFERGTFHNIYVRTCTVGYLDVPYYMDDDDIIDFALSHGTYAIEGGSDFAEKARKEDEDE